MVGNLIREALRFDGKELAPEIKIPTAERDVRQGLDVYTDGKTVWDPAYTEIVEWLKDNRHKGLMLMGSCGRGKTLMAREIIPKMINFYQRLVVSCYDATELQRIPDEVISRHLVMIDDVGTEGETVAYGQRRQAFAELVDAAEKKSKLLLLTTNLDIKELEAKYGQRVVDRLKGLTKCVILKGNSLRG